MKFWGICFACFGSSLAFSQSLPDYRHSLQELERLRGQFIPATISELQLLHGSQHGLIKISVNLNDFFYMVEGCRLEVRFKRSSTDSVVITVPITVSDLDIKNVISPDLFLSEIGLPGGSFYDAMAYAYVVCPGGKTSNILFAYFQN